MNSPTITVVLPVYNAASTIDSTLASILNQSFTGFELIAIDDGSSDDSLRLLLAHAENEPRIRVVARANGGVSSARNLGVRLGKAPYIAFIDADDLWHPDKLAYHLALHLHQPAVAASYARIAFVSSKGSGLGEARTQSRLCPHSLGLADVLGENPVCTASNLFVRRDWFWRNGGFDEHLSFAEDQELVAGLIAHGAKIEGIDEVLTGYRFSPEGLSMDLNSMKAGWHGVAARYLEGQPLIALEALYYRYLARRTLRAGGSALAALGYVLAGLRLDTATFLKDRRRGFATLGAALAAPLIPAVLRRYVFA